MSDMKRCPRRTVWSFLLASAACLAAGSALAQCISSSTLPRYPTPGEVPCFITVQPIDVCGTSGTSTCAPFNSTSTTGVGTPSTAGMPFSSPTTNFPNGLPVNETSPNPIGFVVNPATGVANPGSSGGGVDITRTLLNQLGVDIMWLPMATYNSQINTKTGTTFQTLNVTQGATCTGSIAGTALTIASCSSGSPGVGDTLSGAGIAAGTKIMTLVNGPNCNGTYTGTVNIPQNVAAGTTITDPSSLFQSADFACLSYQNQIKNGTPTFGINPATGLPNPNPNYPKQPLGSPSNVVNMFFVNTLNPPASQAGGKLYGFSWIGNNGVAISQSVFGYPRSRTSPPSRSSNIAHELGHVLGLDHTTFAAGPWTAPPYTSPLGVVPPIPANPLAGECDPSYPACAANLMTTGSYRTEPTVACVLAGFMGDALPAGCSGLPSLYNGQADQVNIPASAMSTQLPESQQAQVLTGGSGLLSPFLTRTGFLNPIPHETTKAQLGTRGSATDPIIFDLSSPAGGKPGETLAAWVLTLPPGQTFAKHSRFHVVSQSREDLVEAVNYYPDTDDNPIVKDISYHPGADNNSANPSGETAADSPCASATAECLMVKFQPPGLGADDSISFSNGIVKSILFAKGMLSRGGAPITNDDLCKAKITFIFSDGYATTSNLGRCPAVSLPLIASSWRPDPTVSPRKIKTDILLAQRGVVLANAAPGRAPKIPPGNDPGNNNPPPADPILDLNGTPIPGGGNGTYQSYTVNFTAALNNTAITFAFREDPSFIAFANASVTDLTVPGANLLTNGNFSGGVYSDNGNNLTPVGWTYANMYGATFGGVVSTTNCGVVGTCWYDGAVQAYDAISQTIATTPGHQYQISFSVADYSGCGCDFSDVSTNGNTTDTGGNGINVTVYAQAGLPPVASMACTPDTNNPNKCKFDPFETGCSDCNALMEADQPGQICSSGTLTGTINGNLTVSAPQNCVFQNPCEIRGNLTINGGMVYLACALDGNLTQNGGGLHLDTSAHVFGNVQISQASSFTLGPGVLIDGNLQIQNLPGTVPQRGTVCGATVKGNLQVQNNASPIEIGGSMSCADTVSGNLQVNNNRATTDVSFNNVSGNLQCQGNTTNFTSSSNTVKGNTQGQCH